MVVIGLNPQKILHKPLIYGQMLDIMQAVRDIA